MKELTIQALSKILGQTPESVSELLFKKSDDGTITDELNEDALSKIEELHAQHIKTAGAETLQAKYDEGHKAGKYEALSKAEEDLRKQFQVEGKTLKDVAAAIAAKAAQDAGTDDKVLTHPAYLSLKTNSEAEIERLKAEHTDSFSKFKSEVEKKERFSSKLAAIEAAMLEAGAVLPKNPTALTNLKKIFFEHFSAFDFEDKETGTYIKAADGSLVKDKHGHPITLEAYAKAQVPNYFDVEVQKDRKSPGNEGGDPPPKKWDASNLPKSPQEFETAYYQITDPKERAEFSAAFEKASLGQQ